ncbi:MAG: hypothetical protein HC929_16930 [Leptolyngbyaceae cyanobacterium SM2_5_2]|nr:hypothetical protein [Leptolyngbyaceae cyanobacterium SM2_5_2]
MLAGGSVLAGSSVIAAALWITPTVSPQPASQALQEECIKIEQTQNFLSRDKLKKLLEVDAQAPKAAVREVLSEPHCVLEPSTNEGGVQAEREAYPLEFDPNTWLIVLYEGDQYAGYDFTFRQ